MNERPSWDEYFLTFARDASSRATCPRASCGSVVVRDHRVLSTGYNGAPAGEDHCTEVGCLIEDNHCQRALHAEVNAIVHATTSLVGATIYIAVTRDKIMENRGPCRECQKIIKAAGIERVVY